MPRASCALLAAMLATASGANAQTPEVLSGLDSKTKAEVERALDQLNRNALLPRSASGEPPGRARGRNRESERPPPAQANAAPGGGGTRGRGRGRGFVLVWPLDTEVTYEVVDPWGGSVANGQTARFLVFASRSYTIDVAFPTWQPGPPAPASFRQAAFSNGAQRIGGRLFLDPTPRAPENGDSIEQAADGRLQTRSPRAGFTIWGIGAEISPQYAESPGGVAEAGTYSLEAEITLSPW